MRSKEAGMTPATVTERLTEQSAEKTAIRSGARLYLEHKGAFFND